MNARAPQAAHSPSRGFTLTELMIVIAIAAILTAVAAPSFRSLTESHRARSASFDLYGALTWARSEAIKRNGNVTVTRTGDTWQEGWTLDASATEIGNHGPLPGVVITTLPADTPSVVYTRSGRPTTSPKFEIDVSSDGTSNVRCLSLDLSGRARTVTGECS